MEKKKCSVCGQDLPLSSYTHWTKKDGTINYLHCCSKCQRKHANDNYARKKKLSSMSKYDNEMLLKELERRGVDVFKEIDIKTLIYAMQTRGYCVISEDKVMNCYSTLSQLKEIMS